MKRKLDDVNKKLECLDERLRNNAVNYYFFSIDSSLTLLIYAHLLDSCQVTRCSVCTKSSRQHSRVITTPDWRCTRNSCPERTSPRSARSCPASKRCCKCRLNWASKLIDSADTKFLKLKKHESWRSCYSNLFFHFFHHFIYFNIIIIK